MEMHIRLDPKFAKTLAEKKLSPKKYPDAFVAKVVDQMRPTILKVFADIEKGYHDGAKKVYEQSGAKKLFAESCAPFCAAFEALEETLEDHDTDVFTVPDANEWKTIAEMLSTCTILCYPSFQLSDLVTSREILVATRDIFLKGEIRESDIEGLKEITRDDIFCLREATDETPRQDHLFMVLEHCCLAAARRMKAAQARNEALMWLDLLDVLQTRAKRYDMCLRPETAQQFAEDFRKAQAALIRIVKYENL